MNHAIFTIVFTLIMKIILPSLYCLLMAMSFEVATTASRAETLLTNEFLNVAVNPQNGAITVTDRRNHFIWNQTLLETNSAYRQHVIFTAPQEREIQFECTLHGLTRDGKERPATFRVVARLAAGRPDLELSFTLKNEGEWRQAAYSYNFSLNSNHAYNLYPHGEGMLVPVLRQHPDWIALPNDYLYGGTLSYMMCLGLVEISSGTGLLTLLPDIESTKIEWRNVPGQGGEIVVPQVIWEANKYRFDRTYTLTYSFSNQGGYVALAKLYRMFFAEKGLHRTLREKAAINPAVNNIAGAPVFWATGNTPDEVRQTADLLKSNGVDRCLFAMPVLFEPQFHYTNQQTLVEVVRHVRSFGYETYRYDQFRDAFRKDPSQPAPFQVNTEAWPDMIVRQEDGRMVQAFGSNSGVICSDFFMPLARKNLPAEFKTFDYSACFLDCIGSVTFNLESECWDPHHLCDKFGTRHQREALLKYVNDDLGRLTGTECGIDYTIPYVDWFEGAATLVRWVECFHPGNISENAGLNDGRMTTINSEYAAVSRLNPTNTPPYTVDLTTKYRIPFYALAHHDEVIVTWRWEQGMNNPPVYWKRKNLWSVLYGTPPMYRINLAETMRWQKQIAQTQRYVSDWVRQVALDVMVDHRFLTADREVQESLFSSGRGVVVNFSDHNVTLRDGQEVGANDYVIFQIATGRRTYQAANGSNVFAQ